MICSCSAALCTVPHRQREPGGDPATEPTTNRTRPPDVERRTWRRGGPRGVANVGYVSTRKVVPAGLAASSDRHREVAGQIDSALDTDAPVVAAMPAAY